MRSQKRDNGTVFGYINVESIFVEDIVLNAFCAFLTDLDQTYRLSIELFDNYNIRGYICRTRFTKGFLLIPVLVTMSSGFSFDLIGDRGAVT